MLTSMTTGGRTLVLALLVFSAPLAGAQQLFKCKLGDGTFVFQDRACPPEEKVRETTVSRKRSLAEEDRQRRILEQAKKDLHQAQQAAPTYKETPTTNGSGEGRSPALTKDEAIDQLTTLAVLIGRGTACGVDTSQLSRRMGRIFDGTFTPGTPEHKLQLAIMLNGIVDHTNMQRNGKSPDSCEVVRRALKQPSSRIPL
jgi:hypothetical protein